MQIVPLNSSQSVNLSAAVMFVEWFSLDMYSVHLVHMWQDVAFVGLASMLHRCGMVDDAMLVTILALDSSPDVVAIHFMLANLYAATVRAVDYICRFKWFFADKFVYVYCHVLNGCHVTSVPVIQTLIHFSLLLHFSVNVIKTTKSYALVLLYYICKWG